MEHKEKQRLWTKSIIIVFFTIILTSLRLFWISTFNDTEQREITNGVCLAPSTNTTTFFIQYIELDHGFD